MLRLAFVEGIRTVPFPGGRGICPTCHGGVIAKCGQLKIHHWAHENKGDCDAWSEPIGPWHLSWQGLVLPEFTEVSIGPHRADILGDDNMVIELQHSPIQSEEIQQRESFYGNMVWLFDATYRFSEMRSGDRSFFSFGRTRHIATCKKPVFLDFGDYVVQVEAFSAELSGFSGFGLLRDRDWFIRTYLSGRRREGFVARPVKSDGESDPWPNKRPWQGTRFPSRWRLDGEERLVPKGTAYIPLTYEWVNRSENRRWPAWSGVISRHPELANGWTAAELAAMRELLNGEPMILEGQLRLMPAPVKQISLAMSAEAVRSLLQKLASHIDAGRIAVLKEETVSTLLRKAEEYDRSQRERQWNQPSQYPRRSERHIFVLRNVGQDRQ